MQAMKTFFSDILRDTQHLSLVLFKIMIPVIIAVKVLNELGMIDHIALLLAPIMGLVGLPGDTGLVWATTLLVNLYAGMAVFISLPHEAPLSTAQITVLASMMLVAHTLPIELRVAQKAGVRLPVLLCFRLGTAILYGLFLHYLFDFMQWLQHPSMLTWAQAPVDPTWGQWLLIELRNLALIVCIIFTMMTLLKILKHFKINLYLEKMLRPMLASMGIKPNAAAINVTGLTLGLTIGGALIIKEAQVGHLDRRSLLYSLGFMSLSHAVIEDTLLMLAIGANLFWILIMRVLMTWLVLCGLSRLFDKLSDEQFNRLFFNQHAYAPALAVEEKS